MMIKRTALVVSTAVGLLLAPLVGCTPSEGDDEAVDTASELTEVEKQTLEELNASREELTSSYQQTREELNPEIYEKRWEAIEQLQLIVDEYEERQALEEAGDQESSNPYIEEIYYDLGELYYQMAEDMLTDKEYRADVARRYEPDQTAADPENGSIDNIYVDLYTKSYKYYQTLVGRYKEVSLLNSRLPDGAEPYPTKYYDQAVYNMGAVQTELANVDNFQNMESHKEAAFRSYKELVDTFPESEYEPECSFRIGLHYYEQGGRDSKYTAIEYFNRIQPEDEEIIDQIYTRAVYRKAWCYYLLKDFDKSVDNLIELLDLTEEMSKEDPDNLQVEKYRIEAYDLVATSMMPAMIREGDEEKQLFDYDTVNGAVWYTGPDALAGYLESNNLLGNSYAPDIIKKSIQLYIDNSWYPQSIALREYYCDIYPNAPDAVKVFAKIIEDYERWYNSIGGTADATEGEQLWIQQEQARIRDMQNEARARFVDRYEEGSAWYEANKDNPEAMANAREVLALNLFNVGAYTYTKIVQNPEMPESQQLDLWQQVIDVFSRYLEDYPLEEHAYEANFYLAMALDAGQGNFELAGDNFVQTVFLYEKTDYNEISLWNAAGNYLTPAKERMEADTAGKTIQNMDELTNEQLRAKVPAANPHDALPEVVKKYIFAAREYGSRFPSGVTEGEVKRDPAELLNWEARFMMAYDCFDGGRAAYESVLELPDIPNYDENPSAITRSAVSMKVAESWFQQHYFRNAAEWFRRAAEYAEVGSEVEKTALANAANSDLISQEINEPEYEEVEGTEIPPEVRAQYEESALGYLQVARDNFTTNPEVSFTAFGKAVNIYYDILKDYPKAAEACGEIVENFPDHPEIDTAIYTQAMCYYEMEEWASAARTFESVLENDIESPKEPYALYRAGLCYENLEDWENSARIFTRYAETYEDTADPNELVDSYYRAATAMLELGQREAGRELLMTTVNKFEEYNAKEDVVIDPNIPAKAYFTIGEMLFEDEYVDLRLNGTIRDIDMAVAGEISPLIEDFQRKTALRNELAEIFARATKSTDPDVSFGAAYMRGQVFENYYLTVAQMSFDMEEINALADSDPYMFEAYLTAVDTILMTMQQEAQAAGRDQAVETYETIISQAEKTSVQNEWVDKSMERLVDLVPAKYMQYPPIGEKTGIDDNGASIWELEGAVIYSQTVDIAGMSEPEPPPETETTDETVDETVDGESPDGETPDETVDGESPDGETPDETVDGESPDGETPDETTEEITDGESTEETTEDTPDDTVEDTADTEDTEVEETTEETALDETPDETPDETVPDETTEEPVTEDEAPAES